jgi:salicylate hydroxylase
MGYGQVQRWIILIAGDVVIDMRMLDDQCYFAAFHRAKLIQVLYEAVSSHEKGRIHVKKRLVGLERLPTEEMKLTFLDGTTATADLVIGADGIRSVVRSLYVGDTPIFSGFVAFRGLPPIGQVRELWPKDSDVPSLWTQQGKHIVTYYLGPGHIELIIDIQYQPVVIY